MAAIGLNVPADGRATPEQLAAFHATWIRIVAKREHDLHAYFSACQSRGIRVMLVLARESFDGFASWADAVAHYGRLYATNVAAYQVGNEADLVSPSSWDMPVSELVKLGKTVRAALPDAHLVCSGMASGDPSYLDGADLSWADSVACHPYLKDAPNPSDLEDLPDMDVLVREYQRFGKPVIVSEWGWWGPDSARATEEVDDAIGWAANTSDCAAFFYFALLDDVPPFGLLKADGKEKPRAAAFRRQAAGAKDLGWPTPSRVPEPAPTYLPWKWFTAEQIATATACKVANVKSHWPRLVEQLTHCGINDRAVQTAMIGTVAIETASTFEPVREAFWLDEDWRRFNLRYYPYYGRGYIQLTWESNYRAYGPKIAQLWGAGGHEPDFDLVGNPDKALDPDIAAAAAALYFRDHADGAIPIAARAGNWREVRRLVQGGTAGLDRLVQIVTALGGTPQPLPQPTPLPFHADAPIDQQPDAWSCALQSVQWLLRSIGRNPDASDPVGDPWLRSQLVPGIISPDVGLRDGSGQQLAAWVTREYGAEMGFAAQAARVTFDDVLAGAGVNPMICGGHRFGPGGHWIGVRQTDGPDALLIANPANGFTGIQQRITRTEWNNRGAWDCVWIDRAGAQPAPAPEPEPQPSRLSVLLREVRERLDEIERIAS